MKARGDRGMTIEEAIELLVNATYSDEWQGKEQLTKANLMAIEALSEPKGVHTTSKLWNTCDGKGGAE